MSADNTTQVLVHLTQMQLTVLSSYEEQISAHIFIARTSMGYNQKKEGT